MARRAVVIGFLVLACGGNTQGGGAGTGGVAGSGGLEAGVDAATDDAAPNVCDQGIPSGHGVRVCAVRKVGPTQGSVDVSLSGPVLATGHMSETSPCAMSAADAQGFWFEAADASGEVWVLGASIPGTGDPLKTGDAISAKASRTGGGFSATIASLTLRDANGKLIAYAGEGGDTPDLAPPDGVSVVRGEALCTKHDSCGTWSAYDLDVTASGATQSVAYGSIASVGSYQVAHGGCELQAPSEGGTPCPDWYIAHVAVGITPAP